jgi:hypothetical protein
MIGDFPAGYRRYPIRSRAHLEKSVGKHHFPTFLLNYSEPAACAPR